MGYQIQYENSIVKTFVADTAGRGKGKGILIGILLLATILGYTVHSYYDVLMPYIIPGDPQITVAALDTFVKDIKAGENLSDAFSTFCEGIIANVDIPG